MTAAWVGVVSRSHVHRGVKGGFMQLNHGQRAPLERLEEGDWVLFYSPKTDYPDGQPLKAFTAVGRVHAGAAYSFQMPDGEVFFRKGVTFETGVGDVPVAELADRLHFIEKNPNWGMLARRGAFEIDLHDLELVKKAMKAAPK